MLDPKGRRRRQTGYRRRWRFWAAIPLTNYIVKEDGQYKLLDTIDEPNSIALEMLDRIRRAT